MAKEEVLEQHILIHFMVIDSFTKAMIQNVYLTHMRLFGYIDCKVMRDKTLFIGSWNFFYEL